MKQPLLLPRLPMKLQSKREEKLRLLKSPSTRLK